MSHSQGPSPKQIRKNRISMLSTLLFLIAMPVPIVMNLPVPLIVGGAGACIGAFCVFRKSNWWLLLIPLWWVIATYGLRELSSHPAFFDVGKFAALSVLLPPTFGYYTVLAIVMFERSNIPQSSYYVQWSDGQYDRDHINDPTTEQILAEFDKLDGSKRSTLRIQEGLKRVDICVLTDELTLFYYTDNHKTHTFWHAVYSPGYTQEGEYYGPIGGLPHATFDLYTFITRANNRQLLEEFLTTGQRPQSPLWLDCETESDIIRPWWS
ncbi:MAG: hypothetical protein Q4C87_04805 [Actinomycetaceae bacterium]|nr:hypothetical protein [Actinomycetaceae bacterium]